MKLEINNLGKKYPNGYWGVKNITLELNPGVTGLLGPNGAGKSTLLKVLATISKLTEGSVKFDGIDLTQNPDKIRSILGYLPQDFGVYPNLTAIEFLQYIGAIKGLNPTICNKRAIELLELLNLKDAMKKSLGSFSGGMRQRVGIAQALINDPYLLIVDEPTVGLDPQERVRFRNLIADLSGERIVILSTHIVSDIEATATDIAIINRGDLVSHNSPEQMLKQMEGKIWEWSINSKQLEGARSKYLISGTIRRGDGISLKVISDNKPVESAISVIPTLEDSYLYITDSHNSKKE